MDPTRIAVSPKPLDGGVAQSYSMLQLVVHVPLVLFLVWALNSTLHYIPPALP